MITVTTLPETGVWNKYSGLSTASINGGASTVILQNQTDATIANYVKDGTTFPTTLTQWGNEQWGADGNFERVNWFDISFDYPNVVPTGIVNLRIAYECSFDSNTFHAAYITNVGLWFKKVNSQTPAVSGDILIGSGTSQTDIKVLGNVGNSGVVSHPITVFESQRNQFKNQTDGYFSVSGQFVYTKLLDDVYTEFGAGILDFDLYYSGEGNLSTTNTCNLYTIGQTRVCSGNIPLYVFGPSPASGVMNLYTKGPIARSGNNTLPLNIFSTTNSGSFKVLPLTVGYLSGTPDPRNAMQLYTTGPGYSTDTSSLNLYLYNSTSGLGTLDLFVKNTSIEHSGSLAMYISTPSGGEGSVPYSGNMNLFINRQYDGIPGALSLFAKTTDLSSGTTPLYIAGNPLTSGSLPLYTNAQGLLNSQLPELYTHGI